MSTAPLLDIQDLTIQYRIRSPQDPNRRQKERWVDVVRDISLRVEAGQSYGLVGETGSGKTTLAMGVMRYLPENGRVARGSIHFAGQDLLGARLDEMRRIWGAGIGLVPQNPQSSLNPSLTIGEQLAEGLRLHLGLDRPAAMRRAVELLGRVQIGEAERVARNYPHQISGGMQQRVMIAMALGTSPDLLLLDEPTTSLDATTQASILDLIRRLLHESRAAVLYVTHNLGVVAQMCDQVAVLYAGELVEDAPVRELFRRPLHPYTQALLDCVPRLGDNKNDAPLTTIDGQIPALGARPDGCIFRDRCPLAIEICRQRPPLYTPEQGRRTRCHRWEDLAGQQAGRGSVPFSGQDPQRQTVDIEVQTSLHPEEKPTLRIEQVNVHYDLPRSLGEALGGRPRRRLRAVDGVSLEAAKGKTLGLVGESGSGKTTLARAIVGLVERTSGEIFLDGILLPPGLTGRDLDILRRVQMVFQNPDEALNPYRTVGESLRRPLIALMKKTPREADAEVQRLLAAVRLPGEYAACRPGQLSGGEKQRIAIARVFASHPNLLLADEPVSSLDVSVQASILNLLHDLQRKSGNTLLFISHDLSVVGYLADEVAVMYLGQLMEITPAAGLFRPPHHPYTEALLSAVPLPDPMTAQQQIRLEGEIPGPQAATQGCPFHTRCPRNLGKICAEQAPPWQRDVGTDKLYFCHIPPEELTDLQSGKV